MNNISFIDLFHIYKETDNSSTPNLTEKNIYKFSSVFFKDSSIEKVPVFSGSTLNEGVAGYVPRFINLETQNRITRSNNINFYKNDKVGCLTIVADGKAGFMFYRDYAKYPIFTMNISCLALFLKSRSDIKKKYPSFDGLMLKWFYFKYYDFFLGMSSGEGVSHFTKNIYKNVILTIPSLKDQEKEFSIFNYLVGKRSELRELTNTIEKMKYVHIESSRDINNAPFFEIFNFEKGTHGFTEEAIYKNLPDIKENLIAFWGGDITHDEPKRFVSYNAKNIKGKEVKYFDEKECIILTVDGASAGSTTYKNNIKFTLNHHAGVLTLKKNFYGKIDLEWFSFKYEPILKSQTVSTGSKTLSNKMLGNMIVEFYDDIKIQKKEANVYRELNRLKNKMEINIAKISSLMKINITE